MNSRLLAMSVGFSLLVPAWVGLFSAGVPTLYCPMPTLTILPAFLLDSWNHEWNLQFLAVLVPTIPFLSVEPRSTY